MNKLSNTMVALVVLFIISFVISWNGYTARAAPGGNSGPPIDSDDIGGKVHVKHGSAAGVWVIAETDDLPTGYRKIVVTDDTGNFVIPDLPDGTYHVWVRGYGLVDSTPVNASPGQKLQLKADLAETAQEAAEVYPGNYWYSLLELPNTSDLPPGYSNQASWESQIKLGCELCHQVGDEHTRDLTTQLQWDSAWMLAGTMNGTANGLGRDLAKEVFSDWGARIADGEVPPEPPRPQGIERNVVITEWDWGDNFAYAHDEVSTDKRNPSNALYRNGKVWAVDLGEDRILAVDPMTNEAFEYDVPTRGGFSTPWCLQTGGFCTLNAYINPANPHNPMLDDSGHLAITTQIRSEAAADRPDFCLDKDSSFIFAGHRQAGYFDTNTEEFSLINTCFGTHHLQFDDDGILWFSGDSAYIGWVDPGEINFNTCGVESCPDEEDAQGWSRVNIDQTGTGDCDTGIFGFHYGIIPNPTDGSVWTGVLAAFPGNIQRFDPSTGCHEIYQPPAPGFGPRGIDVDTNGNVWTCLGGSSHVAKFDRSLCVANGGHTINGHVWGDGTQCQGQGEGWQLWEIPGPQFQNCQGYNEVGGGCNSDFHYYAWVDQFNTLGLGANEVFCNGTGSDSLIGFNPQTHVFTRITVPYPLNFYQRGLDGRIDDPNGGWKGKGLWVDNGGDPIEHAETEMGQIAHVQLRPNPLAH